MAVTSFSFSTQLPHHHLTTTPTVMKGHIPRRDFITTCYHFTDPCYVSVPRFSLQYRSSLHCPHKANISHWNYNLFSTSGALQGRTVSRELLEMESTFFRIKRSNRNDRRKMVFTTPCSSSSQNTGDGEANSSPKREVPFGYSRKDVLLIGFGVTLLGFGLKSGLEFVGVDPLQAGNIIQLVLVLGLTIGWISTYIFRVSNKEMTYAQQLRNYEKQVMQKRLEGLTEAELEVLLEQVEEEKRGLARGEQVN